MSKLADEIRQEIKLIQFCSDALKPGSKTFKRLAKLRKRLAHLGEPVPGTNLCYGSTKGGKPCGD